MADMNNMEKLFETSDFIKDYFEKQRDVTAQYSVSETVTREISYIDDEFSLFRTLFDSNVGVGIIVDKKPGKTSTNSLNKETIKETLDNLLETTKSGMADDCFGLAPEIEGGEFTMGVLEPDIDKLMERAKELIEAIKNEYPKILLSQVILEHIRTDAVYRNTNGTEDVTHKGSYGVSLEFAGKEGDAVSGISGSYIKIDNLDTPFIELGRIRRDLEEAEMSANPTPVEGKFVGKIIFTPECFMSALRTFRENALSDGVLIDKSSPWADKMGSKVASDLFTFSLKPWDSRIIEHEVHTVDGFRSEDFTVIENGVLKNFCTTLYGANKTNGKVAPNSSSAYVVEPGDTALEDMIKGIEKGLIVGFISCGAPGVNGELAGVAKNAFYIENGEIKHAVTETMISFNLITVLHNIIAISKETLCSGDWVIPYIMADDITISGK